MSPVRLSGRKVTLLAGTALLLVSLALGAAAQTSFTMPADAPTPAEGKITRILTTGVLDEGTCADGQAGPCWDVSQFAANPGDVLILVADLTNSAVPHNLHAIEPGSEASPSAPGPKSATKDSAVHTVAIVMPEEGGVTFICDVHPTSMVGHVVTPAEAAAAGGAHESVPALGVHFLAYWVGVIAFAILFVVYGATFFLFKYNETRATTDHFDRSESTGDSKRLAAAAPILAVVIAVVAIAAIIYVATR